MMGFHPYTLYLLNPLFLIGLRTNCIYVMLILKNVRFSTFKAIFIAIGRAGIRGFWVFGCFARCKLRSRVAVLGGLVRFSCCF